MSNSFETPESVMRHALELAALGEGFVEPNPMVGAVVVDDQLNLLGEGYHQQYGGPHAEIHALRQAGERARGATLYVTLEPCCHHGKTPPCTEAVIAAGIKRVVVAARDPYPAVAGKGIERLREAGVTVETGLLEAEAISLTAPFRMLVEQQRPFVIAKWAMSLDGKIASRTGMSQWISNEASRAVVHQIRARVDGILVGIGTVLADDPMLTARPTGARIPSPPGQRIATRIVLDRRARLPLTSQLVLTAAQVPTLVIVSPSAAAHRVKALRDEGVEVVSVGSEYGDESDLSRCLQMLGQRRMTNVLVEGGAGVFGRLLNRALIDEVHAFVAPILIGGDRAPSAIGGLGFESPKLASKLINPRVEVLGGDVYVRGRFK